jgi:hypothetical protein
MRVTTYCKTKRIYQILKSLALDASAIRFRLLTMNSANGGTHIGAVVGAAIGTTNRHQFEPFL